MSSTPITFVDAVARGFRRTTDFRGRTARAEFWYWVLFTFIIRMVTVTIDGFIYPADLTAELVFTAESEDYGTMLEALNTQVQHSIMSSTFVVELLLLPSTISVTIRRLRDAGWKPWIAAIAFASNYIGLVVTVFASAQILPLLAETFGPAQGDSIQRLAALMLSIIIIGLVSLGFSIATLVGVLQRSASSAQK